MAEHLNFDATIGLCCCNIVDGEDCFLFFLLYFKSRVVLFLHNGKNIFAITSCTKPNDQTHLQGLIVVIKLHDYQLKDSKILFSNFLYVVIKHYPIYFSLAPVVYVFFTILLVQLLLLFWRLR